MMRKWDTSNTEVNKKCIDEVVARLQEIDDYEHAGVIAAQDIIDIVTDNLGPEIYNNAINDTKKILLTKQQDLEYEIEELKQ